MKQERPLIVYLLLFIAVFAAIYLFFFLLVKVGTMQDVGIEQCVGNGYPEEYCRSLVF